VPLSISPGGRDPSNGQAISDDGRPSNNLALRRGAFRFPRRGPCRDQIGEVRRNARYQRRIVDAAGQPEFTIHESVAWDALEWTPQWAELAAKADVDAKCCAGVTALWLASKTGHLDVVKALLGARADFNATQGSGGRTALMIAISTGHLEVAQVLVQDGVGDGVGCFNCTRRGRAG
jgi:hypothetical protein